MSVTLADFRVRFPEFVNVSDGLVQACIDEAVLEIDTEVWGDRAFVGVMYLAAHRLSLSPYGQGARLVGKDDKTTYYTHFIRCRDSVQTGWIRVA